MRVGILPVPKKSASEITACERSRAAMLRTARTKGLFRSRSCTQTLARHKGEGKARRPPRPRQKISSKATHSHKQDGPASVKTLKTRTLEPLTNLSRPTK